MIRVNPIVGKSKQIYEHLDPVVDYLLANGNELAKDFRWGSNREGYFCVLKRPIDLDGLKLIFEFPPSIFLVSRGGTTQIYCEESGAVIRHP